MVGAWDADAADLLRRGETLLESKAASVRAGGFCVSRPLSLQPFSHHRSLRMRERFKNF